MYRLELLNFYNSFNTLSCFKFRYTNTIYHVLLKYVLWFQEIIKNKQCGYDVRKPSYVSTHLKFLITHSVTKKIAQRAGEGGDFEYKNKSRV